MKTGRKVQTGLFLESLRHQFDQMSMGVNKDDLYAAAQENLNDGFSDAECVELLVSDGYDPDMARACISSLSGTVSKTKTASVWNYDFEDSRGDTVTSMDRPRTVVASSSDEAWEAAEVAISDAGLDYCRITKVYPV